MTVSFTLREIEIILSHPSTMPPSGPLTKYTSNEIVSYTIPETNQTIHFSDIYLEANDIRKTWILCDLCHSPMRIFGSANNRKVTNVTKHRGSRECSTRKAQAERAVMQAEIEAARTVREKIFGTMGAPITSGAPLASHMITLEWNSFLPLQHLSLKIQRASQGRHVLQMVLEHPSLPSHCEAMSFTTLTMP